MRATATSWPALLCLAWLLVACAIPTPAADSAGGQDLIDTASAQATAIVGQARATAMVLQAQTEATALMAQVGVPTAGQSAPAGAGSPGAPTPPAARRTAAVTAAPSPAGTAADPGAVVVTSVSFAAEGAMIMVQFRAPAAEAEKWWPGNVSLLDEETGTVYDEIPVMPKIGPLIGRPRADGQLGYVMLVNPVRELHSGSPVTVVLGSFYFEHIAVD